MYYNFCIIANMCVAFVAYICTPMVVYEVFYHLFLV